MKYKSKTVEERFSYLHPKLKEILAEMDAYCLEHGVDFTLTETVTLPSEDAALGRKSDTHVSRRAADLRTRDWKDDFLRMFMAVMEHDFGHVGAINSQGKRQLLVYHDSGHGPHIHCQLSRDYWLPPIEGEEK